MPGKSAVRMIRGWVVPLALGVGAGLMSGCGPDMPDGQSPDEHVSHGRMSFEEFAATVPQESDTGVYLVEGDIPIHGLDALRQYYETYYLRGALIQHIDGYGNPTQVDPTRKMNMTYCVDTVSFGTRHATVTEALLRASTAWEDVAELDFVHLSAEDGRCNASNAAVWFNVEFSNTLPSGVVARAFFPNESRDRRVIRISSIGFEPGVNLAGILRHELGHALGFAHEHRRVDTTGFPSACSESGPFVPWTPTDRASVMFYPYCGGKTHTWPITTKDVNGAVSLYGAKWRRLDGNFTGGLAVTHTAPNRLDLFVRGNNGVLHHRWFENNVWSAWEEFPGAITSSPAAVSWSNHRIDVFARGPNNNLVHKWFDGSNWSNGWEDLGGVIMEEPAVTSMRPGRLDVFARGLDNALWHKWYDRGWSGWESLGGGINSGPGASSFDGNRIDVFARGAGDSWLWQKTWDGVSWLDWSPLGGILTSSPAAHSAPADALNVSAFWRGTDNALWQRRRLGRKVYDEGKVGGVLTAAPAVVTWGGGWVAFVRGTDGAIYHTWFNVADPNEAMRESFESYNYRGLYMRHQSSLGELTGIYTTTDRLDASFKVVPGLANSDCYSFVSFNYPTRYLRHSSSRLRLDERDGSALFDADATFCARKGLADPSWTSWESYNYPGRYIRHSSYHLYVTSGSDSVFNADATWRRAPSLQP